MATEDRPYAGLYVHVPFCHRLCPYCDFYSRVPHAGEINEFIKALEVEASIRARGNTGNFLYDTIFLGGGTPSLLTTGQIECIFYMLRGYFDIWHDSEVTIECNPSSIDASALETYQESGINRISLGLQSFNDKNLMWLGRLHDSKGAIESFRLTGRAGFRNINIDLIYGLPEQTLAEWRDDLSQAVDLGPTHVSAYNLIIEPETAYGEMYSAGRLPLLSEAAQAEMYDVLNVMLFDAGYMRYEISNFAKPGYECRHNLKYWHLQPYLGLGPAAVSFDGRVRTKNSSDLDRYLELAARGQPPPCEIETLDQAKLREEYIMMALRLGEGLSVGALEERFGFDIMKEKTREIESLVKSGHITLENGCIRLAKKALFISDEVIVRLI